MMINATSIPDVAFYSHCGKGIQIVVYLTVEEYTKGFPRGEAVANRLFETDLWLMRDGDIYQILLQHQ